ncbi:MAG TPA: hypothetical protein VHL34_05505 [Rhizomicrobium sp.]|jgi:hypothetical protein|nr:hypothetical protein [Rhizomicrobium sp.]
MTKLLVIAAAALAIGTQAVAAPVCLDSMRIDRTKVPDAKHIEFHMQDGSVWSNELKNRCPGLLFNGFIYEPFAGREVCENLQTVRVIQDHQVCMLGAFTKIKPARGA